MRFISQLSLRNLFISIIAILLLPTIIFSTFGFLTAKAQQVDFDQIRTEINATNQMINDSVFSPFYMSPRIIDPCDPRSLRLINYPASWKIEYHYSGGEYVTCEWIYYKDNEKIVIDGWNSFDRKLAYRQYFQNGKQIVATDSFFVLDSSNQVKCVKQRQYEDFDVVECYSEAGSLISVDPTDKLYSPLPPMLYWFAYR